MRRTMTTNQFFALLLEVTESYTGATYYQVIIDPNKPPVKPFIGWTDIDDWRQSIGVGLYELPADWEIIENQYGQFFASKKGELRGYDIVTLQRTRKIPKYLDVMLPIWQEPVKAKFIKRIK